MVEHALASGEVMALDGKTRRGSHDGARKVMPLVSAVLRHEGIVVAHPTVGAKSNEIRSDNPRFTGCGHRAAARIPPNEPTMLLP